MNIKLIEESLKEYKLKINSMDFVVENLTEYFVFNFEFVAYQEEDPWMDEVNVYLIEDNLKLKVGNNIKNAFEKKIKSYFN